MSGIRKARKLTAQKGASTDKHFARQVYRLTQLRAMGAQQIQRCALTKQFRDQHLQAAGQYIGGDIEPGFASDPGTGHGPKAHDIGIVTEAITADGQADFAFAVLKTPVIVDPAGKRQGQDRSGRVLKR